MPAAHAGLTRQGAIRLSGGAVVLAAIVAALVPQPQALAAGESLARAAFAGLASAAIVAAATVPLTLRRQVGGRTAAVAVAIAGLILGIAAYLYGGSVQRQCTAQYSGRSVLVGTELTELGQAYRAKYPQASTADLLEDSPGDIERVWTRRSIAGCRQALSATYFLWIPLLLVSVVAAVLAVPGGGLTARAAPPVAPPGRVAAAVLRYDAFISYRHAGADAEIAAQLVQALEAEGYTVAIDERDFQANASFLQEMERAIRESRFTIAIVSERYLQSGHTEEEAILTKVLDMGDRKRRLIPFLIQRVDMPAWLYGLVGIDATREDTLVDPLEKLKATLGPPLRGR